jgi:hypothetical protein
VSSNPGKIQNFLSVFFRLLMNKIYSRTLKNLITAKYIKKIKKITLKKLIFFKLLNNVSTLSEHAQSILTSALTECALSVLNYMGRNNFGGVH